MPTGSSTWAPGRVPTAAASSSRARRRSWWRTPRPSPGSICGSTSAAERSRTIREPLLPITPKRARCASATSTAAPCAPPSAGWSAMSCCWRSRTGWCWSTPASARRTCTTRIDPRPRPGGADRELPRPLPVRGGPGGRRRPGHVGRLTDPTATGRTLSVVSRPVPAALLPWLDALLCPHCREPFAPTDRTLRCPSGHSFDLARAGYVSLLPGSAPISGDDDDMARARDSFLSTGAYDAQRALTADLAARALEGTDDPRVLDIGCGTGHYLS